MTRLPFPTYLDHIRAESARFREVLAGCDPEARVPSCPDWTAADLLWHLSEVQRFWAGIVRERPATPEQLGYGGDQPRPAVSYGDLLDGFDRVSGDLCEALAAARPQDVAWTWSAEQTVGFTFRRQAHEALIHRLDAELTGGVVTPLDPALAADGVHEALDVMFGGTPAWGSRQPDPARPGLVRVDATDTDTQVWVGFGLFSGTSPEGTVYEAEQEIYVLDDPGTDPDVVVEGTAGDLDAWLWRRRDDAGISVAGDEEVYAWFRQCVDQPID